MPKTQVGVHEKNTRLYLALPSEIELAMKDTISQNEIRINELLSSSKIFTWRSLMIPLDEMRNDLQKAWYAIEHLQKTRDSEEVRMTYESCSKMMGTYNAGLLQNEKFLAALQFIISGPDYIQLDPMQQVIIERLVNECHLAGAQLSKEDQEELNRLKTELRRLNIKFINNVDDATNGWVFHTDDIRTLDGLSEEAICLAAEQAKFRGKTGWVLTIDAACYFNTMNFLKNRSIREQLYKAYVTCASDQGSSQKQWDNTPIMELIVKTRHQIAKLLGFSNYAQISLSKKTMETPEVVLELLLDLISKAKPFADKELKELKSAAETFDGLPTIEPWDIDYYSQALKAKKFDFDAQTLRSYFPINKVLKGLFDLFNKIFDISIIEKPSDDKWDELVTYYEVSNSRGELIGSFFADLYARPNKKNGPGCNYSLQQRKKLFNGSYQHPLSVVICNLNPPLSKKPVLLSLEEVKENIFHEFGHCLQLMLTKADYTFTSGLDSIPWDTIEFPSSLLEYFVKQDEVLRFVGRHEATDEPIPAALINKSITAINFQSGIRLMAYLDKALLDIRMHTEYDPINVGQIQLIVDNIRAANASMISVPAYNRSQNTFTHAFAGLYDDAYAAGYYSYVWSDILATNALTRFKANGMLDERTGVAFKELLLESAGWGNPGVLLPKFCGHSLSLDEFLKNENLILTTPSTPYEKSHPVAFFASEPKASMDTDCLSSSHKMWPDGLP